MLQRCLLLAVIYVAGLAAPADAQIRVPFSGWSWGAPTPQGHPLREIALAGGRGYAIADNGTLLRSDDAGASWIGLHPRVLGEERLVVLDRDSLVLDVHGDLHRSDDGGRTFRRLRLPKLACCGYGGPAAIDFPTPTLGFVVDGGRLLRTQDGGRSFERLGRLPSDYSDSHSSRVAFADAQTAVVAANERSGRDARIYRTTDAARSWHAVADLPGGHVWHIVMLTANVGYAVGKDGLVARTSDAAATWTIRKVQLPGARDDLLRIACADERVCYAIHSNGPSSGLVRLVDGEVATVLLDTGGRLEVTSVAAQAHARVVVGGFHGEMLVSDDAGATFRQVGATLPADLSGQRRAPAPGAAWAFGAAGRFARTGDGGRSWTQGSIPGGARVRDVAFADGDSAFALDAAGHVFRTDDGGETWRRAGARLEHRPARLLVATNDRLLAIGPRGVLGSSDGAETFRPLGGAIRLARLSTGSTAGGTVAAFGRSGMWVSRDGGRGWRRVPLPPGVRAIRGQLVTGRTAHVLAVRRGMWTTRNLGRTWERRWGIGGLEAVDLSFADARHGFARLDVNDVLRTDDGGLTWRPQRLDLSGFSRAVLALDGRRGIALAGDAFGSALAFTESRGDVRRPARLSLRAKLTRRGQRRHVELSGRLLPARRRAPIRISIMRTTPPWRTRSIRSTRTAGGGRFTASFPIGHSSVIVAHTFNTHDHDAAGARPVRVPVPE